MSYPLRREEVLDGDQLKAMLNESPARAAQAILVAAREGVLDAQALLGQILLDGQGIEQDQPLAVRWFGIAAQRGHLMARNMLGRCHEHGWGCVADASVAARHYRVGAEAGLDWAMYNYANLLATGRGVIEDQLQALELYRRAAELGHAKSMNLLGRYLEDGRVCLADPVGARDWYRRSAVGGDFRGQFSYAAVLADEGNINEALKWLRKALAGGNLNFLRVASKALLNATDPQIREMATDYAQRSAELELELTPL
ncbi:sel1 repeat family protein [Pseudomonas hormoni]|uniref:Sel1 repeat family protein n=1 Tax=Pseudomonas hormoni TaxID=3093767 RepID=A0ABX8EZU7_9PSED|nr:tetratricopeptide repeat protein [Pseudomonas hormoni]QVW24157.1 sel1 repeat family protein [Pseudomonas hormoni]